MGMQECRPDARLMCLENTGKDQRWLFAADVADCHHVFVSRFTAAKRPKPQRENRPCRYQCSASRNRLFTSQRLIEIDWSLSDAASLSSTEENVFAVWILTQVVRLQLTGWLSSLHQFSELILHEHFPGQLTSMKLLTQQTATVFDFCIKCHFLPCSLNSYYLFDQSERLGRRSLTALTTWRHAGYKHFSDDFLALIIYSTWLKDQNRKIYNCKVCYSLCLGSLIVLSVI